MVLRLRHGHGAPIIAFSCDLGPYAIILMDKRYLSILHSHENWLFLACRLRDDVVLLITDSLARTGMMHQSQARMVCEIGDLTLGLLRVAVIIWSEVLVSFMYIILGQYLYALYRFLNLWGVIVIVTGHI